ncbi:conserved Plasmodium protein, unknown function [Plasmodium malariae]|uniref:Pre-mRNA polyadenylation factor Fip1 domain-containing protein n=1 Tax=Plasmodium malariae TaxID=5858 RepID=A0A1C3KC18_PLAMA|nr:conserved Plasmodium protein, unknown function [Plasmodium malariae]
MEDSDEEDNIQVIVFGNSTEANFDDFYRETELSKDENEGNKNNLNGNAYARKEAENEEQQDVNLETQVQIATKENKVFMKYDYTHEKPWAHHADKSMWFNYNLDENSFKDWVQKHIDRRIEQQQNYQIENADNIYDDNLKTSIFTQPRFEEDLLYSKNVKYRNAPNMQNMHNANNMKYAKNMKKKFLNSKNSMMNNFNNKDKSSSVVEETYFNKHPFKNEDGYRINLNKNPPNDRNTNNRNNFTQNYDHVHNSYNRGNSDIYMYSNGGVNNSKLKNEETENLEQNEDLTQFQNFINFFKQNQEI